MLMSLSTVSTTSRCIAQETFCEFVRVVNVTIIIIIIIIIINLYRLNSKDQILNRKFHRQQYSLLKNPAEMLFSAFAAA